MSVPAMAVSVTLSKAVPNTNASQPSLTSNANPLDTPPATGLITVPQSPSGAITTNTGRTLEATTSFLKQMNVLNGWNGVRTPTNPV